MEYVTCPHCKDQHPATALRCPRFGAMMPKLPVSAAPAKSAEPAEAPVPPRPVSDGNDPFADFEPPRDRNRPLVVCTPDGQTRSFSDAEPLRLGRDAAWSPVAGSCTDNISWHHAEIRPSDTGPVVVDHSSTNGTFVNSQRLGPGVEHPIRDGDEVRLGGDPPLRLRIMSPGTV